MTNRIPVILDTDIGTDIDDSWAIAMMLRSPELDVKLIVSATGNTTYRAKLIAKMLEAAGRTDIPIGIGLHQDDKLGTLARWVEDYDLSRYPGTVYADGVGALVNAIMSAPEPVTLISIAPLPNIAAALDRQPPIAERARFVGMHGSVRRGYRGSSVVSAEYNVKVDPRACQNVFAAPWDITITPLDTCGLVRLHGAKYRRVLDCPDPLIRALMESNRIWAETIGPEWRKDLNVETDSSELFDTVAIYLGFSEDLLRMENLGIRITDDGYTRIDEGAWPIHCATDWKDLSAFEDLLVARLTGNA